MMEECQRMGVNMQSINVTDLKTNLADCLRQVQQGRVITITERNQTIARLVPPEPLVGFDEEILALAAQGKVRLPEQPLTMEEVEQSLKRKLPRLKVKGAAAKKLMQKGWNEEQR
jgi:prevent-host-death family protein